MKVHVSLDEGTLGQKTILEALERTGWNKSKAARLLGVNVRTIYRKLEKFNILTEKPE
jgi:transcriptional regulator of acetoin/glycerol metabolism